MTPDLNAPRWDGRPGFYEVWYLTLTDRATGVGIWIRHTLRAPVRGEPTASVWFAAMDPAGTPLARRRDAPAAELDLSSSPFRVALPGGRLDGRGTRGEVDDVAWDLRWHGEGGAYRHVRPALERARIARTVLVLPHADLEVSGTVRIGPRTLELDGVRGGQAHLWGTKHAARWAWVHCNDFEGAPGDFVDGVSVCVNRLGRELGPSTPILARVGGRELLSTAPHRVAMNASRPSLTGWSWEAGVRGRRIVGEVAARREHLAGVTYEDPDGERAYCYNTEIADLRLGVWEGGVLSRVLEAPGRAHFEYAQREPVPGVPLLL